MRTLARALVVLGVLGLLLGNAAAAGAHAVLESSQPTDGSSSEVAPSAVELTFDEQVDTRTVTLDLHTGDGRTVPVAVADSGPSTRVLADLPRLDHGAYDLRWSAVSVDDRHPVTGSVAFGVGTAVAPAGGQAGPMPPLADVARQWGLLAVTAAVVAVLVVVLGRRRGWLGWSAAGLATLVDRRGGDVLLGLGVIGATLVLLPASGRSVDLQGIAGIPGMSIPGWALALLGAVVVGLAGRAPGGIRTTWCCAGLSALVLGQVVDSHVRGGWGWGLILGLHLLAAAAWAALVATLVIGGVLQRRDGAPLGPSTASRWGAATAPAVSLAVIVVATGLLLAGRETASLDAVLRTTYGRWLLVKTALLVVATAVGGAAWRRRGAVKQRRTRGRAELAALTLALGAAAALSLSTPATGPAFLPAQPGQQAPVAEPVADLFLTADLAPDVPGPAVLRVEVNEVRHPGPGAPTAVTADLVGPSGAPSVHRDLHAVGAAHWSAGDLELDMAGSWWMTLRVVRPGVPDVVWSGPWLVASPAGSAPALLSAAAWSGVLDVAAVLLLASAALGWLVARRGRHHGSITVNPPDAVDPAASTPQTLQPTAGAR